MKNNKNGKRIIWTILSTIMAASIILGDFMPGAVVRAEEECEEECEHEWYTCVTFPGYTYSDDYCFGWSSKPGKRSVEVCRKCGETRNQREDETVYGTPHNIVELFRIEPTYDSEGYVAYICSNCGSNYGEETLPKLTCTSHNWDGGTVTKAATYSETGSATYTCSNCGATKQETIPQLICTTHNWDAGKVTKEATREATGIKTYTCKNCGQTKTETIEKVKCAHSSKRSVQISAGTCAQEEVIDIFCNDCGESLNNHVRRYKDPDNHVGYKETITKPATYNEEGIKTFTCTGCGYSYTESIPKMICDHSRTCVKDINGIPTKVCEDCGKEFGEVKIVLECKHSGCGRKEVVVTPATATQWGEYNYVCERCGKVLDTKRVHPYSEYHLKDQNGNDVTVYGYFDDAASQEVYNMLNDYRVANGLNRLHYNSSTQEASNQRALEAAIYFSHTKPNGSKWNTTCSQWRYGGENIASGQTSPESVMNAWKNSTGHNENMLYGKDAGETPFKGVSVGVFHRFLFISSSKPSVPTECITWSQNFTFYEY